MDDAKIKTLSRLDATILSIQTALKALEHSERTVDRVARQIKHTEGILRRIRGTDAFRKR